MQHKEAYQSLMAQRRELEERAKQLSRDYFNEAVADVFVQHPKLESFSWTQYTPHFNDGDPCTFGANTNSLDGTFDGQEYEEASSWSMRKTWNGKEYVAEADPSPKALALQSVFAVLRQFDNDFFQGSFGDGVRVTATARGVTEDDYDHN